MAMDAHQTKEKVRVLRQNTVQDQEDHMEVTEDTEVLIKWDGTKLMLKNAKKIIQ